MFLFLFLGTDQRNYFLIMTRIIAYKIAKLIENDERDEIIKLLEHYSLEERRLIISENVKKRSLLYLVVKDARLLLVNYFLENCDTKPDYLWAAAATANFEIVKTLVEHGADVNGVDQWQRTALYKACWSSYLEMVKYLLDNGADVNKADYRGTTCLMVSQRNIDLFKYLLSKGAFVDQMNDQGKTALMLAVESQNMTCLQVLLSFKADASCTNEYGENAIFLAANRNQTDVLEKLRLQGYQLLNNIVLNNEIKSCHLSVCGYLEKAETYWKTAMSLQNLPTDTPIFQAPNPVHMDEKLRVVLNYLEPIDGRAVTFLVCRLNLLNPYTLILFSEAISRIADLNDFMVAFRYFFGVIRSANNRLFFQTFLENFDLIERLARRNVAETNAGVKLNRLWEMFQLLASHFQEAGKRIQKMNAIEKISSLFYMESYFCNLLDFLLIIDEQYPGELYSYTEVVKSLIDADLRGFGNASLFHICILKGYPVNITRVLLSSGADLNCKDDEERTPVFYALESPVYRTKEFIDLFIHHGLRFDVSQIDDPCFVCCLDKRDLLRTPVKYISLQCLAATAVAANRVDYKNYLPPNLQLMVYTHSGKDE